MKKIIEQNLPNEINFEIIGNEKPILQIILLPGQSIMTRANNTIYSSDNIQLSK